jgi:tryptophan synthase
MEALKKVFQDKKAQVRNVQQIFLAPLIRLQGSPALVTFVTAGFPTRDDTPSILLGMQAGGTDVIELGIPFSDPIADGPTIQAANTVCFSSSHGCIYSPMLRLPSKME